MMEAPPSAGASGNFFNEQRFMRFKQKDVPFGKSILKLPDHEAVIEEGRRRAGVLEADAAQACLLEYKIIADNLQKVVASLESVDRDTQSGFTSATTESMGRARNAYKLAAQLLTTL